MAFNPHFIITPKINNELVEIERVRGFFDGLNIRQEWFMAIQEDALIAESHASTHIEGNPLTLEQATDILQGKDVNGVQKDHRKELVNYKRALELVADYMGRTNPITEGLIKAIHKMLVNNVRGNNAQPGQYRTLQNYVVNTKSQEIIYTPPSPETVPALMRELIIWMNKKDKMLSPVLAAGIAQFQFVHIHPFCDGNGRTARLLSTLILYKTGYDFKRLFTLSEYYDKNRPSYYTAIQSVREHQMDLTPWIEYFVSGLRNQIIEIHGKSIRVIKHDNILKKAQNLNLKKRLIKVLNYLAKYDAITRMEYVDRFEVSPRTANYDLELLVEYGLIKQEGIGRSIKYTLI